MSWAGDCGEGAVLENCCGGLVGYIHRNRLARYKPILMSILCSPAKEVSGAELVAASGALRCQLFLSTCLLFFFVT